MGNRPTSQSVFSFVSKLNLKRPDSAGRILIGKQFSDKLFSVKLQPNGDILLSPVIVQHEREAWLASNTQARESVHRGLEQSGRGETHDLGSFSANTTDLD